MLLWFHTELQEWDGGIQEGERLCYLTVYWVCIIVQFGLNFVLVPHEETGFGFLYLQYDVFRR